MLSSGLATAGAWAIASRVFGGGSGAAFISSAMGGEQRALPVISVPTAHAFGERTQRGSQDSEYRKGRKGVVGDLKRCWKVGCFQHGGSLAMGSFFVAIFWATAQCHCERWEHARGAFCVAVPRLCRC